MSLEDPRAEFSSTGRFGCQFRFPEFRETTLGHSFRAKGGQGRSSHDGPEGLRRGPRPKLIKKRPDARLLSLRFHFCVFLMQMPENYILHGKRQSQLVAASAAMSASVSNTSPKVCFPKGAHILAGPRTCCRIRTTYQIRSCHRHPSLKNIKM